MLSVGLVLSFVRSKYHLEHLFHQFMPLFITKLNPTFLLALITKQHIQLYHINSRQKVLLIWELLTAQYQIILHPLLKPSNSVIIPLIRTNIISSIILKQSRSSKPMSDQYQPLSMIDSNPISQSTHQAQNRAKRNGRTNANNHMKNKRATKSSKQTLNSLPEQGYKSSLWKLSENAAYMAYLLENEQLFYTSKFQRKNIKINVQMSNAVKTRSPDQCRSHHQKMVKYHTDIPNIIAHIQSLLNKQKQAQKNTPSVIPEERAVETPLTSPQQREDPNQALILVAQFDLESWIDRNEIFEQQRLLELWLDGVQDKYGNMQ